MFGLGSLGSEDQNQESGSGSGSSESDSAGSRCSVSGSGLVPEAKLLRIPRARGIIRTGSGVDPPYLGRVLLVWVGTDILILMS